MNKAIKLTIIKGLFSGLTFALFMELFRITNGDNFIIWRFFLHFAVFGGGLGYGEYYRLKRKKENEAKRKQDRKNNLQ